MRDISVNAVTPCRFLVLHRDELNRAHKLVGTLGLTKGWVETKRAVISQILGTLPFFSDLEQHTRAARSLARSLLDFRLTTYCSLRILLAACDVPLTTYDLLMICG